MKTNKITASCLIFAGLLAVVATSPLSLAAENKKGEELYIANCAKCHGFEGEGFSDIYPSIKDSRFLKEKTEKLPCIIRLGSKGELSKRKSDYDQNKPPTTRISASEMGELIQYMQKKWDHTITVLDIDKLLQACEIKE